MDAQKSRQEIEVNGDMAGKRNKLQPARSEPKQPTKCKNCMWGAWTGTKQFCSKQQCVKQGNPS